VGTVLDTDGIFVKLPPNVIPGSKPWVRLDFSALSQQAGISLGSLGQLRSADPSQALEFLKGAVGDMRKVGTETVRDAQTTHYAGTLDLKKASSNVSADVKPAVDQAISSLGTSKLPADVWLDDQGRVRKLHLQAGGTAQATAPAGTVELELYDFGTPANVQPPPADQVTDLSNIFGSLPHS
jgi:hypothetical protein